MASGRQAFSLVTRTSSDRTISEDTGADPVNHPALVKTSDQPSFSSANFSLFTSPEAVRPSDISPVPSLNLQPNTCVATAKKITSST